MLKQLYIKNVAVIRESNMELSPGFNVFTGETGAGKSILIGSISAVLGERTSKDLIRSGEEKAVISALFTEINKPAQKKLEELGFETEEDSVLISREISSDSKSNCRINGRPATVSMLKELASLLISIHGQHDNQALLSPQRHLEFIDRFADDEALLSEYREEYRKMISLQQEIRRLSMNETEKARMIDLLSYQVQEIDEAALHPGEEEELAAQKKAAQNAEGILRALNMLLQLYEGEDYGLISQLDEIQTQFTQLSRYLSDFDPFLERVQDFAFECRDAVSEIQSFLDSFDFDEETVNRMEERLDLIYQLKRKYGSTVEEILQFGENAREQLETVQEADNRIGKLTAEFEQSRQKAKKLAEKLNAVRISAAEKLIQKMQTELSFLDMPFVRFELFHQKKTFSSDGMDEMELLISANPGETPKPLSKIASGGELSRIMLAMKNALADKDDMDTLIFDEVDAGVGGRAAVKVGAKLKQAARHRQVICVTHLAQVAALADRQLFIQKKVEEGRTYTSITALSEEERIGEIARMIGGDSQSVNVRQTAKEMLDNHMEL